jgi:hypothetical protein
MSRPKPQVLIEITNKQTYKTEQVLASEGVWAVFYDNKPINLKTSNMLTQYPGPKYKKVSFSNPGHAKNLARKLNTQFQTTKFSVVLLTAGDKIHFTAFNKEDKWFIEEIINVIKPPMQKVTFKQRQANRLMEANY